MAFIARSGIGALVTPPEALASRMSAAPNSRPMSDGLIGAACICTTTSSAPGAAVVTLINDSSNTPVDLTRVRSWLPVRGPVADMGFSWA